MYYYRQIKQYCPLRHWGAQGGARLVKDAARMLNEVDSTALTYLGHFTSLRQPVFEIIDFLCTLSELGMAQPARDATELLR